MEWGPEVEGGDRLWTRDCVKKLRDCGRVKSIDADLRLRAPRHFWGWLESSGSAQQRDPRLPAAGTELRRRYRGQEILVRVEEDGFTYNQRRFSSLSAIAYE